MKNTHAPVIPVYEDGLEFKAPHCHTEFRFLLFRLPNQLGYLGFNADTWRDFYVVDDFGQLAPVTIHGMTHYRTN